MGTMEEMEQALQKSGWHVTHQAVLDILDELSEDSSARGRPYDDLVAQLLNADIKDVGSPCLPDSAALQRLSKLQGPLVVQVVSVRNISQSSSKAMLLTGQDQHGRLLCIRLTDGHNIVSAIEYRPMPAFSLATAPGTKVKVENTIPIQNGFLLCDARSFTILGGRVETLFEAWEIERKYSVFQRLGTLKSGRPEGGNGPPPFHGLSVTRYNASKQPIVTQSQNQASDSVPHHDRKLKNKDTEEVNTKNNPSYRPVKVSSSEKNSFQAGESSSTVNEVERYQASGKVETTETSEKRKDPEGRAENIKAAIALSLDNQPLQNRAAAQRLLERKNDGNAKNWEGRGRGNRGRGNRERFRQEEVTLTLDEWEARKGGTGLNNQKMSIDEDEALARRLHYELNLNSGASNATIEPSQAEQIRLSMFNFAGDTNADEYGSDHGRGRGRGRGKGRGRGRGRRHA